MLRVNLNYLDPSLFLMQLPLISSNCNYFICKQIKKFINFWELLERVTVFLVSGFSWFNPFIISLEGEIFFPLYLSVEIRPQIK